jgi:hypothetical protein
MKPLFGLEAQRAKHHALSCRQVGRRETLDTAQPARVFRLGALICLLAILTAAVTLFGPSVRAEHCFATTNGPARQETGGSQRLDRITQDKCRHMRAADRSLQLGGAVAQATSGSAIPIPRPRPAAAGVRLISSSTPPMVARPQDDTPARSPGAQTAFSSNPSDLTSAAFRDERKADPMADQPTIATNPAPSTEPGPQADEAMVVAASHTPSNGETIDEARPATNTSQTAPPIPADTGAARVTETPPDIATAEVPQADTKMSRAVSFSFDPVTDSALPQSNTAYPTEAAIGDTALSVPTDSVLPQSPSSKPRPNGDGTVPATRADRLGLNAIEAALARLHWQAWLSWNHATPDDTPVFSALMSIDPLYMIVAFIIGSVVVSYYVIYKGLQSTTTIGDPWPDDPYIEGWHNNPEFYEKLRRAPAVRNL